MIPFQALLYFFVHFYLFFCLSAALLGVQFSIFAPQGSVSHTQHYCNNGSASIEVSRAALKCRVNVCCRLDRTQDRSGGVYVDLDLHMCFALVLLPFTGCREGRQNVGGYRGETNSVWRHKREKIMIAVWLVWNTLLLSIIWAHQKSPTTSPPPTARRAVTESRVRGWTAGQAVRCKILFRLRQQLCTGPLLQIFLALRLRSHGLTWSPTYCFSLCLLCFQKQIFPVTGQAYLILKWELVLRMDCWNTTRLTAFIVCTGNFCTLHKRFIPACAVAMVNVQKTAFFAAHEAIMQNGSMNQASCCFNSDGLTSFCTVH